MTIQEQQETTDWWRHTDGRWVVGDAGRQPEIVPAPSTNLAPTRPDTVVDGGRVGRLEFRAASLRGFSHQQTGTPRQDAYAVRATRDHRWLVGCVADGVSAGRRSHEAADLACQELTTALVAALPADADVEDWDRIAGLLPWQDAVDRASNAIVKAADGFLRERYGRDGNTDELARLDDQPLTASGARTIMSTTAVAFVLSTVARADGTIPVAVTVAAGDSSALLLTGGGWQPLTAVKDDGAEIASSAVVPLPGALTARTVTTLLRPGDAVAVITDGVGDPLGQGQGIVGRFLTEQWREPPDLLAFAQQVGFYRKTFADDRTAVVAWATPEA